MLGWSEDIPAQQGELRWSPVLANEVAKPVGHILGIEPWFIAGQVLVVSKREGNL